MVPGDERYEEIQWPLAGRDAWESEQCEAAPGATHQVVTIHDRSADEFTKGANFYYFIKCQRCGKQGSHRLQGFPD